MKMKSGQTWLFSFTDLAFLLLISLSLIPSAPNNITLHLAEMDVPVVPENGRLAPIARVQEAWELQVFPVSEQHPSPYRLVRIGVGKKSAPGDIRVLAKDELVAELARLRQLQVRPMLLPEKNSLSQDFLYAAGAIAQVWTSGGRTVVQTEKGAGDATP
jgi:hypothetical protein